MTLENKLEIVKKELPEHIFWPLPKFILLEIIKKNGIVEHAPRGTGLGLPGERGWYAFDCYLDAYNYALNTERFIEENTDAAINEEEILTVEEQSDNAELRYLISLKELTMPNQKTPNSVTNNPYHFEVGDFGEYYILKLNVDKITKGNIIHYSSDKQDPQNSFIMDGIGFNLFEVIDTACGLACDFDKHMP